MSDIEKVEENTTMGINALVNDWSFEDARYYLDKAFESCSSQQDLAYYNIISTVCVRMNFKTRNGFQTKKVSDVYSKLFEYFSYKFKNITEFKIDKTNEEEALMLNNICVDIIQRMNEFAAVFTNVASRSYYWGIIPGLISTKKAKNKFLPYIKSIAQDAAYVLRKYNVDNPTIRENIGVFENA